MYKRQDSDWETINQNEEYLDYLNKEITRYTAKAGASMQYPDSEITNTLFQITGDIERIGDHAMNLVEYARMIDVYTRQPQGEVDPHRAR